MSRIDGMVPVAIRDVLQSGYVRQNRTLPIQRNTLFRLANS